MLELDDLRFNYASASVRADFSIARGRTVALMGASGSGKTTVLDLIAGFRAPHHGTLRFNGENLLGLPPAARPLTYLLQAHNLFPHLSVRQNLAIGLHPGMRLTHAQNEVVDQALEWVSLREFAQRKPPSLSGGQQQRVALARCLARDRPLLLLDEPFTGVDDALRAELLSLISALQKKRAMTVLITTHQARDARALDAMTVLM